MDRAELIVTDIERFLCSQCCDRLYDQPKAEPCEKCGPHCYFNRVERARVLAIVNRHLSQ